MEQLKFKNNNADTFTKDLNQKRRVSSEFIDYNIKSNSAGSINFRHDKKNSSKDQLNKKMDIPFDTCIFKEHK